jgi:outer membrane protein assembly factor BamE (lipoprotein component of BamABCDE complex)
MTAGDRLVAHRTALAAAMLAAVLAVAGCEFTRQAYEAVSLGQTQDDVKKTLGPPTYRTDNEWVYTRSDPRDLVKVVVRFDEDKKVAGKSWQNPDKPWENHRQGQV